METSEKFVIVTQLCIMYMSMRMDDLQHLRSTFDCSVR